MPVETINDLTKRKHTLGWICRRRVGCYRRLDIAIDAER